MSKFSALQKYFNVTGTAEGDGLILESAFIDPEESLSVINPPFASPRLLVGRKGSGKSAYLRAFQTRFLAAGIPVLLLKPEDLDLSPFAADDSMGEMVKKAKASILQCIAMELGKQLGAFLTSKHQIALESFLVNSGAKPKDAGRKLHDVLVEVAKSSTSIDFAKITDSIQSESPGQLKNIIYQNAAKSGKIIYLMLDDTDQVASPTDSAQLNRIWAFILAARSVLEECAEIRAIISIRMEVWIRLQRDKSGQRDQVDHFRGLVHLSACFCS